MTDWTKPAKTRYAEIDGRPGEMLLCQHCGKDLPIHPLWLDFIPYCSDTCAAHHTSPTSSNHTEF